MKKVAVILSGCGVHDGAEIHESVLTLLALDRAGAEAVCAAPDIPQAYVFDHQKGKAAKGETRNVRTESARIARGPVRDVADLDPAEFDAVIVPGGYGAAKNLSDFAFKGTDFSVNPDVAHFLQKFHATGKPIGLLCIAPAIGARLFGKEGFRYTIGNDDETATALAPLGGKHVNCGVEDIVVDDELNIVTTPAYMLAHRIGEAEVGITKAIKEVLARA
jgi:enhancing lycopene biosynthesis protein 2